MSEEEKDIEYLEKYINWETYGERSLEKAIETILRLYKAEKEKNKEIKEKLEEMNVPIETLLAEFERLENLEDDLTSAHIYGFNEGKRKYRDKIKAKIEELENMFNKPHYNSKDNQQFIASCICILEELLEEE